MSSTIDVRRARLDDTAAISALFRVRIPTWQRIDAQGSVQDLPYEQLTLYERWLHGGPWMSLETGAIFLSHLLRGAGLPLVAVVDGHIRAYAEAYPGREPAPYGVHLHIAHLLTDESKLADALLRALVDHAADSGAARITVSIPGYDAETAGFYQRYGLQVLEQVGRVNLSARTGQGFYKTVPHYDANPAQISGWPMTVGRDESARYHWETLWPRLWDAVPEITARRTDRLRFSAAGQESYVCCRQHLYDPRSADIFCWSPKPLTAQLITAIRDWAHREHYRSLTFTVPDATRKLFGSDAEPLPHRQEIYALDL